MKKHGKTMGFPRKMDEHGSFLFVHHRGLHFPRLRGAGSVGLQQGTARGAGATRRLVVNTRQKGHPF